MPAALTASAAPKPRTMASATHRVEIFSKPGFSDPAGAAILAQLPSLGITGVTDVKVGALYEFRGPLSPNQMTVVAKEVLADPITQDFALNGQRPQGVFWGPHWRIEVWLKSTVSDPVESSLIKAVGDLGLPAPESARQGTVHKFWGRLHPVQAEKIAMKLLANPVVHRTVVESV